MVIDPRRGGEGSFPGLGRLLFLMPLFPPPGVLVYVCVLAEEEE